jgi:hypothetical protein
MGNPLTENPSAILIGTEDEIARSDFLNEYTRPLQEG